MDQLFSAFPLEMSKIFHGPGGSLRAGDVTHVTRSGQHQLDPVLVKAVDFCGTATLKDAAREQVEEFVQKLADSAHKDRNALLCQLNSYARPDEKVVA